MNFKINLFIPEISQLIIFTKFNIGSAIYARIDVCKLAL